MKFFLALIFILPQILLASPEIYLFLGGGTAKENWQYLNHKNITGAQIIYSWKKLEPEENK